jgi:hypothetical protein
MRTGERSRVGFGILVVLLVLTALRLVPVVDATVPATMSYQGMLKDNGGQPLYDGDHALIFRIYNVEAGGSALWQESQTLATTGGRFNALLGSVTPLSLAFDAQYWLETVVDGFQLSPRVKLASSPYAQRAAVADAVAGGTGDITAVYADNGLTGGATGGDAHLSVGAGTGIEVAADAVGLASTYASGAAYDARFVNEAQANAVTADMIQPNVVSGVDGVVNDSGNIDLIAGSNIAITPDDANNTITIASTGGGGIGGSGTAGYVPRFTAGTTIGNSLVYDTGSAIGIGTTSSASRLTVNGSTDDVATFVGVYEPSVSISTPSASGAERIFFSRGGVVQGSLSESQWGLILNRDSEEGGIHLWSARADGSTAAAVNARYTGGLVDDYIGLHAESKPADDFGIGGDFEGGYIGAQGRVNSNGDGNYIGLFGAATPTSTAGSQFGVYGQAHGGILNYGVYGIAWGGTSYAGFFSGDVYVGGSFFVAGSKSFRIDHPTDPANKYLNHFCTESDEVLDTYRGNVVLGAAGEAWVQLADWYGAINRDPSYQLTCVGGYAPVYVAEEIQGNRFRIAGGTPGLKVSWQVTAARSDRAIEKYRVPVEQEKPAAERGRYLNPDLYGMPETMRVGYIEPKSAAR